MIRELRLQRGTATLGTMRDALDRLGIRHGEDFVVGVPVDDDLEVDENRLGPSNRTPTSRAAAFANIGRSGTQRRAIFELIAMHEPFGVTRDDLAALLGGAPHQSVTPRVWELKRGGFVQESGETRTTSNGEPASVLELTPKGMAEYNPPIDTSFASVGKERGS